MDRYKSIHPFLVISRNVIPVAELLCTLHPLANRQFLQIEIFSPSPSIWKLCWLSINYELKAYILQWTWENKNTAALAESMEQADREMFFFNLETLDWFNFILHYVLGTRKYVLKQDPSSIPACKRKLRFLWFCDRIIKIFFVYFLYKIFVNILF